MIDKTELAISAAQDASRNKHADALLNAAHARLIEATVKNPPPAFALFPTADEFENAKDYLIALASALDDVAYQVASEANGNASFNINTKDRIAIFSNALHDSDLLSDLAEAGERLREEAA